MPALPVIASALILGEILFAPAPADVVARNGIEHLVLTRAESASREIERWLADHPDAGERDRVLVAAGFRRVQRDGACPAYVYSRRLTAAVERGASILLCDGRPPFVLRSDEAAGPWSTPDRGNAAPVLRSDSADERH